MSWADFFLSFFYGIRLDMSIMGYLTIIPALLIIISNFIRNKKFIERAIYYYTIIFASLIGFLLIADIKLYTYWDMKLDSEALKYLDHADQIQESVGLMDVLFPILVFLIIVFGAVIMLRKKVLNSIGDFKPGNIRVAVLILVLSGNLFFPIRGGIDLKPVQLGIPISASAAYFSENIFANHAALNPVWYLMDELLKSKSVNDQHYSYLPEEQVKRIIENDLLIKHSSDTIQGMLNTTKPNLIFIVVESLTANVIESLGGMPGVTPCINALSEEGVLFDNFYSTGTRSDKGLASIFNGFPALPKQSVMESLNKCQKLPSLYRKLKNEGYNTGFYYGGDLHFVNFGAFFKMSGADIIVGRSDYDKKDWLTKWGVPDHIQLARFFEDIDQQYEPNTPFFYSIFTISSHDPFDVPMEPVFEVEEEVDLYKNSVYYVDKAIGEFVANAKKQSWWDNTLIVITADHGTIHAHDAPRYDPIKFRIPMLWIGGAVKNDTVIAKIGDQTDIPATVLNQLGLDYDEFKYSKDILSSQTPSYGFYTFNEGFGLVNDTTEYVYSFILERNLPVMKYGLPEDNLLEGKAFMQYFWEDYLDL